MTTNKTVFNRCLCRVLLALVCAGLVIVTPATQPRAQQTAANQQSPENRIALYQALLDLSNPWTVMCVAAHPDDEDGTSLVVMRRKYGAHTVSLFSTFGEGGQNAIGPELYEELGAIRARETMAASEIQGSEPHFLGLKDFGFSKSADETFQKWGHDEALRRMVLQIRKLRPDVIITNHSVTSNDHGHHQATARLVVEAFDDAADPKRFPEQLKDGMEVWQVQRLFVRVRGSQTPPADAPLVTIDPNERDPVRGTMFAEQALSALQKHATQGPWPKTFAEFTARFRAFSGQGGATGQMPLIRYRLAREAKAADTVTTGSQNFLDGLRLPKELAMALAPPLVDGKPLTHTTNERRRVLNALIDLRRNDRLSPAKSVDPERSGRMNERLNRAFAAVTRITATTTPRDTVVTPGVPTSFTVTISNKGDIQATIYSFTFFAGKRSIKTLYTGSTPFPPNDTGSVTDDWTIPKETIPSLPHADHLYDGRVFGEEFREVVTINLEDIRFTVTGSTNVDVAPPIEIVNISPLPLVVTSNTASGSQTFSVTLTNHQRTDVTGRLGITTNITPVRLGKGPSFALRANETKKLELPLGKLLGPRRNGDRALTSTAGMIPLSVIVFNGAGQSSISTRFAQAVLTDAKVADSLNIAYIRGFDFSLPSALKALGVESKELTVNDLKTADLQKYSSIIVDNRVYESQPELIAVNQKLLDYANAGGTLIVFYHKSDEWNPDQRRNRPQLASYKLILGNERITDENAPITFLEPQHPLLNVPNKLGPEDFTGWIQERGLYYPKEWDAQFRALLQSNDPGEAPLKGGLLVADYGKGHYIYSSMVWYRQLRAGVPGAYRMLANMISYGREK